MNELLKDLELTRENASILAHHDKGSMLTKEYTCRSRVGYGRNHPWIWITDLPLSSKEAKEIVSIINSNKWLLTNIWRWQTLQFYDTMKPAGMAELLYNLLECQFEPSPGIADGQNKTLSRMLKNKNYFKVFTSLSQRNRTTPLWTMLATIHDFTLISMSGATSAQGGHPLYETARKLQDLRLVSSLRRNRLKRKRSDEFVNEGRINPTIWIDSRLTNRLRLSSLEEAHNARGVAKRHYYQSPEFERATILRFYDLSRLRDCRARTTMTTINGLLWAKKLDEWIILVTNESRYNIAESAKEESAKTPVIDIWDA